MPWMPVQGYPINAPSPFLMPPLYAPLLSRLLMHSYLHEWGLAEPTCLLRYSEICPRCIHTSDPQLPWLPLLVSPLQSSSTTPSPSSQSPHLFLLDYLVAFSSFLVIFQTHSRQSSETSVVASLSSTRPTHPQDWWALRGPARQFPPIS